MFLVRKLNLKITYWYCNEIMAQIYYSYFLCYSNVGLFNYQFVREIINNLSYCDVCESCVFHQHCNSKVEAPNKANQLIKMYIRSFFIHSIDQMRPV
jgi:hypothetical protein